MFLVDTLHQTYDLAGEVGATLHTQTARWAQRAQDSISHTYQTMGQGFQQTGHSISQTCHETADKSTAFVYANGDKILFVSCCITTAYFSPTLFFGAAVVTIVLRVELSRNLRNLANEYLKDERNPYKLNPRYENYVSSIDLILEGIAAVDAIALGTLFAANSAVVVALPLLGGIAAGNCAAKLIIDTANSLYGSVYGGFVAG